MGACSRVSSNCHIWDGLSLVIPIGFVYFKVYFVIPLSCTHYWAQKPWIYSNCLPAGQVPRLGAWKSSKSIGPHKPLISIVSETTLLYGYAGWGQELLCLFSYMTWGASTQLNYNSWSVIAQTTASLATVLKYPAAPELEGT